MQLCFWHKAAINTLLCVFVWCHRCMLRVLDSFGTEPEFNHAHYAQSKGHKTPWGKWNLNPQQFNTMFRKSAGRQHTPLLKMPLPTIPKWLVSYEDVFNVRFMFNSWFHSHKASEPIPTVISCIDRFKIQQKITTVVVLAAILIEYGSAACDVYLSGALQHSEGSADTTEGNTVNTIK